MYVTGSEPAMIVTHEGVRVTDDMHEAIDFILATVAKTPLPAVMPSNMAMASALRLLANGDDVKEFMMSVANNPALLYSRVSSIRANITRDVERQELARTH